MAQFKELLKFGIAGTRTAIESFWSNDQSQDFLHKTLASMPGIPAKFSQLLGMRDSATPHTPNPMPLHQVTTLIQHNAPKLAAEIDTISSESKPASIGQIHQVRLKDGRLCAVKIQYPEVAESITAQLDLFFKAAAWSPARKYAFDIASTKQFIRERLLEELNYEHEARTQQQFADQFHVQNLIIPVVLTPYCSKTILVQSWEESRPLNQITYDWPKAQKLKASLLLSQFVCSSLFEYGILHTDLQPSNYGFREDNSGIKLVIYDFGSSYTLTAEQRHSITNWLRATAHGDLESITASMTQVGFDTDKLRYLQQNLTKLSALLLEPLMGHGHWNPQTWNLQDRLDELLGEDKWWFRTAGPPWFLYLMRTVHGWHHGMKMLDVMLDHTALQSFLPVDLRAYCAQENLLSVAAIDASTPAEQVFKPLASHLRVLVTEGTDEIVDLSLPARAIEDLEALLPEHIAAKCSQDGIDLVAIKRRAINNGAAAQELFATSYGARKYRVWLA